MPHKRAKRSVREAERTKKGYSLPPSKDDKDDMPRGAMRILNAGRVQAAFRASGRTTSEDTGERKRVREEGNAPPNKKRREEVPKIAPNESLGEYNRRVEALLRGGVSGAIKKAEAARGAAKTAAEEEKRARVAKAQGKALPSKAEEEEAEVKFNKPEKAFKEVERRRLNDVAQAPPSLPRLRMAEKAQKAGKGRSERDPLNAGQRRIMEAERERVVALYRDMKAKKEAERAK
ncbi:hypothetical protein CspeluHIS016_0501570 [Cutaneotrichosporon spelunceum]|uniref:Uncharacterized protein n=1 Tax=Cutaneotrichosporon spelunceum TaxID=1672016 RepID=A0AAD3TWB1_9TREE|nr:hypothetical protein CspeluHIS016_0501570 [Cutaneotrichosporon spelunceum]